MGCWIKVAVCPGGQFGIVVCARTATGTNIGSPALLENQVVSPFGTDHVIAVVTPAEPVALRIALRTAEKQRAALRIVQQIQDALAAAKGLGALSIGEMYTGPTSGK